MYLEILDLIMSILIAMSFFDNNDYLSVLNRMILFGIKISTSWLTKPSPSGKLFGKLSYDKKNIMYFQKLTTFLVVKIVVDH